MLAAFALGAEGIQMGTRFALSEESSASDAFKRLCIGLEEGIDTIFGYPGGTIMPVYDALYDYRDRIRHILVRHEQGAIHAAQA